MPDTLPPDSAESLSVEALLDRARRNERTARILFDIEVEIMNLSDCATFVDRLVGLVRKRFELDEVWLVLTDIQVNKQIQDMLEKGGALTTVLTLPTVDYMRMTGNARAPVLVDAPQRYRMLLPYEHQSHIGSFAVLPLLLEGRVIGALMLGSENTSRYQPDMESLFLEQLAVKASIGLSGVWAREKLRELATRDPLTGLHNRRDLDTTLANELSRSRRYGQPLTLLFIDCDDFKRINDEHGHDCGDAYLCFLARQLEAQVRTDDRVFRFAGDEFVVLLPNQTLEDAQVVCQRLQAHFAHTKMPWEGHHITVKFSQGLASNSQPGLDDARALLRQADVRLYEDKRKRKFSTNLE